MSAPLAEKFKVIMTCSVFEPGYRGGGPIRSVAHMIDHVPPGVDLTLIVSDRDLGAENPYPGLSGRWIRRGAAKIYYLNARSVWQWFHLWKTIRESAPDLLYVNSLFEPRFSVAPIIATRLRMISTRTVLIAPRGELSPGALEIKAAKKKYFLRIWSSLVKGMNIGWHASAELEAQHIRSNFPGATVVVNQDQSGLPEDPLKPQQSLASHARFIFVSRISRMKNLDAALVAFRDVERRVEFDIYGPIEDRGYWEQCQSLIEALPANVRVAYGGELAPDEVRTKFAEYDAFIFPTRGENFGHVIAESLSASCPVICTDQTPWTALLANGGGRIIDSHESGSLGAILSAIASSTAADRLHARRMSGEAFRRWRGQSEVRNIFDVIRS
jgi:glycosyltransferase involved in cell wall biosynthesis